jgi:hypothetical protein
VLTDAGWGIVPPHGILTNQFITAATNINLMYLQTIIYLHQVALKCARLAYACPHLRTAHELEAVAGSLMSYAADLEELDRANAGGGER